MQENTTTERETMAERLKPFGGWASFAVSLLTLAVVVVAVGSYKRQIDVNTERLNRLELRGSPALEAYAMKMDSLTSSADRRLTIVEAAIVALTKNEAQFGAVNAKLDAVGESLKRVEAQFLDHLKETRKGP
jgi:hypothetical protein